MKKYKLFLQKLISQSSHKLTVKEVNENKYHRLRVTLFVAMIFIALGPMLLIATLSYKNYVNLLQAEERDQLEWRLDGASRSFSSVINNITSLTMFASLDGKYTTLISNDNLDELLFIIKQQFPFVTDLEVIDQDGIQQAYSGPYDLVDQDYSKEVWLQEGFRKGKYISSVYLGHRQVPHFTIVVSNRDPQARKQWFLRATIDAGALQQIITTVKTKPSDDLFLVDDMGVLQTASTTFGDALTQYQKEFFLDINKTLSRDDDTYHHVIDKLKGTPWSLVLVEDKYTHQEKWISFRSKLFFLLTACSIFNILVVWFLVNAFKKQLSKTDELQMNMLKEAEHTNKLASVGRLAAGVGHEINNPLAIINQKNGLMEDLLALSPDFEHKATITNCCKSINQSIDRCKAITHRLLGFARRTEVVFEEVQINDIINDVLSFLGNSIMHSKIKMTMQLAEELPTICGDRMQLQQVFLNIINNAIDAIKKNGDINIRTCQVTGDVQVVIQDSGSGIEEEHIAHIFEPFFTTKETGKGTGLGLSITYGLIKEMGGDITVHSHIGKGTAFTITLPESDEK